MKDFRNELRSNMDFAGPKSFAQSPQPTFCNDVPTIILDTRSSTEGVTDFCYSLNSFSNRGKKKLIILKWNTVKRNKIKPK